MDIVQLQRQIDIYTSELAKNEIELRQLNQKLNDLKRKMPENKRKLEAFKRDLLASQALQRRRASAAEQGRNST